MMVPLSERLFYRSSSRKPNFTRITLPLPHTDSSTDTSSWYGSSS